MSTPQLARAHRRDLAVITGTAERTLRALWRGFSTAEMARDGLLDVLPHLTALYGSAAATLGADWYEELRETSSAKGHFSAIPAEMPDRGRTDALGRWAVGPLFTAEPDFASALTLLLGGFQRIVANADRETVTGSSVADPGARGWQRVGTGACAFCAMLIGRGEVYTEASADFASHDHCSCGAVPVFGDERPVQPFKPSPRQSSPADRARAREYIRTH